MTARAPRLCMIVHGEYPGDVRVAREVRAAVAEGFAVHVVATRGPGEAPRERVGGAAVHRLPVSRRRGSGPLRFFAEYSGFALLATLRVARLSLGRRFDVVQVHSPPDFLIVAALVPKLLGARVVLDLHDLSSDMFLMRFGGVPGAKLAERVLGGLERLACRTADVVVTVHEPYRGELARRGVDPETIVVVLNSLDETLLPAERRSAAAEPFRIVYHGTVTPHYGLSIVLEAFARLADRLPQATLEIIGGGDAVPELAARAEALGIAGRVELTGAPLPQVEVLERVQGASVGLIPNLPTQLNRFALSTKLFEYVALGIPVVAADLPTIRRHFLPNEIAFFRAGDERALAEGIAAVADDWDAALARAQAARERYRASYEWPQQARRYARLLTLLASGAPRAAQTVLAEASDA